MKELKEHQPSITIEEQVKNLKSIGMIINDEDKAKNILNDISYFRLIKGFSLTVKTKNDKYTKGVTFEQVLGLYLFNARFRQLLFPEIEKIEINLRCRLANYFSQKYNVLGYKEKENFGKPRYHKYFLWDIEKEIKRNYKTPFVKNFKEEYAGEEIPFYALVEIISFGTLSKFFKNMKNEDKKNVAKSFGVGYKYLESWIETLAYVRNICAHYGRLYNAKFSKTPILYKEYQGDVSNNRVFGILICLKHLLFRDKHWNVFVDDLGSLFEEYEMVDKRTMGFTEAWKEMLGAEKAKHQDFTKTLKIPKNLKAIPKIIKSTWKTIRNE